MKALTIKQPWASLIIEGGKDIENRSRCTHIRGWVLVHAGMRQEQAAEVYEWCDNRSIFNNSARPHAARDVVLRARHSISGIIGAMHIVDCVEESASPWFNAPFGWVIDRVVKLPFLPCKGKQGWFNVELPAEMEALIPKA
jgi:hypothetical protein